MCYADKSASGQKETQIKYQIYRPRTIDYTADKKTILELLID